MVQFFNKSPQFDMLSFSKAAKGSDGRYFIACFQKCDNGPADEIFCQFSRNIVTSSPIQPEGGTEFIVSDESSIDFIKECDEQLLALCKTHKEDWFPGKGFTDSYLDQAFMESLKAVKKQKDTYSLKTRISKDFELFDDSKALVTSDTYNTVEEHTKMAVILQLSGLWFSSSRFGITWKLRQGKLVQTHKDSKFGYSLFVDDEDEAAEDIDNVFPDEVKSG